VKQAISIVLNVLANVVTLLICPFLVLAWIVRVRVLESRARRPARAALSNTADATPRRSEMGLTAITDGGK